MGTLISVVIVACIAAGAGAAWGRRRRPPVPAAPAVSHRAGAALDSGTDFRARHYRLFLDASSDIVFLKDHHLRYVFSNPANCAFLGLAGEHEVVGKTDDDVMPPAVRAGCRASDLQTLETGQPVTGTEKVDDRVYETVKFPVPLGEGRIGVGGFARDITESVRSEQEVRASRQFLDRIINCIADPVFVKNEEHVRVLVNDAYCELFGCPRDDVIGRADADLFEAGTAGELQRDDDEVLASGRESIVERPMTLPDGRQRIIVTRKTRFADDSGHRFVVGVVRDITVQRGLEEQLRHSQKMEAVGSLAGGVAHDFNNILQAMTGYAQLLRIRSERPEAVIKLTGDLDDLIARGAALTRQLLLFSRRETAKVEQLDLNDAVNGAMSMLRRLVRANIAIRTELAGRHLAVEADRRQIDQVLMNLAVNASDAMPDGGVLTIATGSSHDGQRLWIEVRDTGIGIPDAIRERIFDPFFTTKKLGQGTGLGLSVVHGIVTQHHGTIEVRSTPGEGSVFRIDLPCTQLAAPSAAGQQAVNDVAVRPGAGERILLVEDEDAARAALTEILELLGYEVVAVGSGEAAGALPEEPPFALLLSDLMLPGISGTSLARGLKDRWPGLQIILMSGYTEDEVVRHGIRAGDVRFLQKPFDTGALAREMRNALDSA